MNLNLQNKVIIVTGGGMGIGEAICRTLANEGAIPVIAGRSAKEGDQLASTLNADGIPAISIAVELSGPESSRQVVEVTLNKFGHIHGIVNNAGANDLVGLQSGSPEKFRDSMKLNLFHYYDMVHFALPSLIRTQGTILNISSKNAVTGQGNSSAYAAAKGAILALTREWAVDLLKHNIRVNAILPAEVMTPLYEKWISSFDDPAKKLKQLISKIPLGKRMTTKEEIADMAVFLLSDRASHITGQWISVDGGYVHLDRALS